MSNITRTSGDMGTLRHGNIVVFGCLFVAFIQCPRALLSHIHIQLLEYVIPTAPAAPAAAAVSPKSPLCYGVSHVMVLAKL